MQVQSNEWHARLYRWWYVNKYKPYSWELPKTRANLCPYMRAVLFWAPLRALFCDWVVLFKIKDFKVTLNMLVIPFLMYALPQPLGYINYYLKAVAWVIVLIASIVFPAGIGLSFVVYKVIKHFERKRLLRESSQEYWDKIREKRQKEREERRNRKPSTFWPAVAAYLRSFHDRVCPEVEIVYPPPPVAKNDHGYYGDDGNHHQ